MEENGTPQPEYLKGFNEGYLISKHLPDLADKLAKANIQSERHAGFIDGRNQLNSEQDKSRYPKWLKSDRLTGLDKEKNVSKDKKRRDRDRE